MGKGFQQSDDVGRCFVVILGGKQHGEARKHLKGVFYMDLLERVGVSEHLLGAFEVSLHITVTLYDLHQFS